MKGEGLCHCRVIYGPISVYRLSEIPIQSCGQSLSAPRSKAGARLNAHKELRAKRQRSARKPIYRNRPIARTTAKWEPYRPNFVDARDCQCDENPSFENKTIR